MKLSLKVIPSSSKDCVAGWPGETLKVKVKAPPEKGKANKAVIKVLEKCLDLPTGTIEITSGTTSATKIIEIDTENERFINKKLADICNS